ncbi:disease resistance protein RPP13 [Brachypodium distachyon]|uniref:NB-ARC domain-containing protein n=1 Tax=Brachypodium distachyon TaxID=15368 RepID=I1I6Q8_BRADI|nr:disease resistance protein RPP13 [Brachypodium distachyon]XP_024316357.1 disease resistance protein RPP13 [Brachypodium distachyon]XP_024316358.1 disease resistance protein RPP13 [Brachypodium distachyon]KQJ98114.1 hypothetical protein BRADI_3g34967v3 [Brachypodium distachyon]KQJ98115.1 hypothetical protein BRADI_3g34967v3 [Brachypodium distachyon]|eukprot:XP_003572158.1 disease resistance protein RPP13 [Brachypodium distachyon]
MEVGAAVVGALLKSTLPKLLAAIGEKRKQLKGLEVDVGSINCELELIQSIIGCSSGIVVSDRWIAQLRRLADDIKDCIDRFHVGKTARTRFAGQIADLKKRSKDTRKQLESHIRMAKSGGASTSTEQTPLTADRPVGMKDAEQELLGLLQSEPEGKLKVISIIDFGGHGKTLLAKHVYHDRDVRSQFPQRAWVLAAGKEAPVVLKEIHQKVLLLNEQADVHAGSSSIAVPVAQVEKGKDIQKEVQVQENLLCTYVKNAANTSTSSDDDERVDSEGIHAATESTSNNNMDEKGKGVQIIVEEIHENGVHDAELGASTSNADQQAVVLQKTRRYLIVIDDVEMEELHDIISAFPWADGVGGRIIMMTTIQSEATRCRCGNGLPLALDSTSQFFIRELTETGFEEACLKLCDDALERMQRCNFQILSSLALHDLLLYFCLFPRDHPVRRNPLIRRWLAEGLVQPENVAVQNLETLINRNIIHPIQVGQNGKVSRCQPPGMMLDHISDKSMSENFITLFCGETSEPEHVRRLSLHPDSATNGRLNLPKDLSRLHTLAVFPTADVANYEDNLNYSKYDLLRVLDLKECSHLKEKHLKKICDLVLLKYLSLGDTIGQVPRKISRLQLLETLDMRRAETVTVPVQVILLPSLINLLGKFQLVEDDHKSKIHELEKFLSEDSKLERLSGFVTSNTEGFPQLMCHMGRLRKVKIWSDSTAAETNLTHLSEAIQKFIRKGLDMTRTDRSLSIDFHACSAKCSKPLMESLQAAGRLTSLKLHGKLTRFPQFDAKLVEELCLAWTNLSGDAILDGLSVLKLKLKYLKLVEDDLGPLDIRPHFKRLERICLVGVQSLHGITIRAGALPRLTSLHILSEALGLLPGIDITQLGGLEEVALHSGVDQGIKDGWQKAARNHHKRPNLLFIDHPNSNRDRDPQLLGTNVATAKKLHLQNFFPP